MSTPVPEFAGRISRISQQRARVWGLMMDMWNGDEDFIKAVREGEFGEFVREHFQEIGQESLAHGALMSLDVYSRGARRRTFEDDRDAFLADHGNLLAGKPHYDGLEAMRDLCRKESAAWAAGDLDTGRDCRKAEFEHLEGGLEMNLVELLKNNIEVAKSHVWRTLSRIFLIFLATETGHQSSLETK